MKTFLAAALAALALAGCTGSPEATPAPPASGTSIADEPWGSQRESAYLGAVRSAGPPIMASFDDGWLLSKGYANCALYDEYGAEDSVIGLFRSVAESPDFDQETAEAYATLIIGSPILCPEHQEGVDSAVDWITSTFGG